MNHDPSSLPVDADAPAEDLHRGAWLTLRRRGRWEFVERNNAGGAVIIVAVTPQDRILFVEQYRVPIQSRTIEMPAGLVGDHADNGDETALTAAARELEEETGWRAARLEFLHAGPSSSGMSTELIAFVRAYDLQRVGAGGGDASEAIIVHEVARGDAAPWLFAKARAGYSVDPKLFAGLWFLEHERPRD